MILNNKMTVIVDNTPYNGLSGEWGLSIESVKKSL